MKAMQRSYRNGKAIQAAFSFLKNTGRGVRIAANTGYKAGYFMARHPEIEVAKNHIFKNYRACLITAAGLALGILGAAMMITKQR